MTVSALADHLWQSTWFASVAWSLAMFMRRDAASVRFWIWFTASIKFLIPFSALAWIGSGLVFQVADESALLPIVQHLAAPLTTATIVIHPVSDAVQRTMIALWVVGSVVVLVRWCFDWARIRVLVHGSEACVIASPIPVRISRSIHEPGVVGVFKPVLLVPTHLLSTLNTSELDAVIAHEAWHVRRRDNLFAAMHACVQTLFWFHPFVWWIGARLVETREHACDEGAIAEGNEPRVYAEAILRVCKHSLVARAACIANATGGDLSARIRTIMATPTQTRGRMLRRAVVAAGLLGCFALPVATGMNVIATSQFKLAAGTRSVQVSNDTGPAFFASDSDFIYARNISLRELIGHAYATSARDVRGDARWLDHPRYDIELRAAAGSSVTHRQMVADMLDQNFNIELSVRPAITATAE